MLVRHASALLIFITLWASAVAAEPERVRVASLDWEPYIGSDLQGQGYVYQLIEQAFARAGYRAVIEYWPWARAVRMASVGQADVLAPEYYDESRLDTFVYSDPFPGGPVGFVKRVDSDAEFIVDPREQQRVALRGLQQYRFGIVRGYINTDDFDSADFLRRDVANSDAINLRKLAHGRVDLVFIDRNVANYLLNRYLPQYREALVFMEPAMEVKQLYLAFPRDLPNTARFRAAFNGALASMRADGSLSRLLSATEFMPPSTAAEPPGLPSGAGELAPQ